MNSFSSTYRTHHSISGIVLAAGESTRMGKNKQLLPFGDQTIIENVVETLLACDLSEVVVVLGHRSEEIMGVLEGWSVRTIVNPAYKEGMLSSVQCGVRACDEKANAFLISLCDQPFITREMINKVISGFRASNLRIVLPFYRDRKGHPIIVSSNYREEILGLSAEVGLRQLMWEHASDILRIGASSDEVLRDMDYPSEYQRELAATIPNTKPALERREGTRSREASH